MKVIELQRNDFVRKREFPVNSVVVYLDNGTVIVCKDFSRPRTEKLCLFHWSPEERQWKRSFVKDDCTEMIWKFHRKCQRKKSGNPTCEYLMRHSRKHKKSSGGSRLTRSEIVTDYECTKSPLHDFRTYYN